MNKKAKRIQKHKITTAVSILLGASMIFTNAHADTTKQALSTSNAVAVSEGYTLSSEGANAQGRSANTNKLGSFHHQTQGRPQVWISDIGTLLFDDLDGDGFHSGFSITIDVDSEFGDTEVYAKIYLESSDSPAQLLHTTERFTVYGTTSGDEYRVDTELRNNYAADHYSVSIDIHDAWSDELLATANERGFNNLKQLPLESTEMTQHDWDADQYNVDDDYQDDNHHHDDDDGATDVIVTEYAGLFHPMLLLALTAGLFIRRRKR